MAFHKLFSRLTINTSPIILTRSIHVSPSLLISKPNLVKPKPGFGISYRRIVHYPEEYTVKPLEVTNLAGRDPVSGRIVAKGIGGGIKHKFHWIKWLRDGPSEGPPQEEKVIEVLECGCRTAHVALVAVGKEMKYILATENMKAGDIIKTSRHLPRIPVRANEGDAYVLGALPTGTLVHSIEKVPGNFGNIHYDAYVLGALPTGTLVHSIEKVPGKGGVYVNAAGTYGTILRRQDDRIIVQMPSKMLFSFDERCMAVVGRLSNIEHGSTPIGSAQRNRWLGNRPRSGLWKRKDGRHGRKIKPPKPIKEIHAKSNQGPSPVQMTMHH